MIAPYFKETIMAQWLFAAEPSARAKLFEDLRRADVVVIEVVEHRSYFALDEVLKNGPRLSEGFMQELASALAPEAGTPTTNSVTR